VRNMNIKITNYREEIDNELLELFYRSVYGIPTYREDKGSDYVRVPLSWIYRYKLSEDNITKVAIDGNNVVGSLGIVIRTGEVNDKKVKIGCFVDNCIVPNYLNNYMEISHELFTEVETEAREKKIDVICGWDFYQPSIGNHRELFERMNYKWVKGVRWYTGGSAIRGEYPYNWDSTNIGVFWKLGFRLLKYYYKLKEVVVSPLPRGIELRGMKDADIENICELINNANKDKVFAPDYSKNEFQDIIRKNNIHGFVAVKGSNIVGVLTYITAAWSGQMFGKPYYSKNWQTIFGFLPDEFAILPEYQKTSLPMNMVVELAKIKNPEKGVKHKDDYTFISDVVDEREKMNWRRDAFLKFGCTEPKVGYGVILAKSLRDDIKLDTNKIWHLPARYIVAPVPSSSYFQKSGQ